MVDRLTRWLETLGLDEYAAVFERHRVAFDDLPELSDGDLEKIGIPLGPRKRILKAIPALFGESPRSAGRVDRAGEPEASLAAWERHAGERRPVTMLFADIAGSTSLTEQLDPEDTHELLYGATQRMCAAVENHRGTVCRFMGDGVMAMFGAPLASEHHAVDACEAAFEMQAAVQDYASDLEARYGSGLQIRVGLHSGEVVVLTVGEGDRIEYDASGPAVPVAARMEQTTQPGRIHLTAATRSLAGHRIEADALQPVSVKGISEPVPVFMLRRVKSVEEAATDVSHAPLVGRRAELNQFRGMVDTCIEEGQGQALYVRGEPGIGKTRLVEEFSRIAADRGLRTHRGLVLPFGVAKGQEMILSLVSGLLGIGTGSGEADRRQVTDQALREGLVEPNHGMFLNDLLDLPQPAEQRGLYDAMDNATRNRGKLATLSELLAATGRRQPVLLIVEDVHWADATGLTYLGALTRTVPECPALLVMTSRVDGDQLDRAWRSATGNSPLITIDLGPLRERESMALISRFIDADDDLAKRCSERAAGNPLFLEQLLRTAQSGSRANLPESIHSLVLARMDRLDAKDRQALQAASVIGQRFGMDLLHHLLGEWDYDCGQLVERNLIRPEDDAYLFSHALIQEGVYASLLNRERKKLHEKAAEWYAGDDPVLHAEHLACADDAQAPVAFLRAARDQAEYYRLERALALTERGLALVKDQSERHSLTCYKGELLHDLGEIQPSIDAYQEALEGAKDDTQRCDAWMGLAAGMRIRTDYHRALEFLHRAESVATGPGLARKLSFIHHMRGNLCFSLARTEDCRREHQVALDYARKAGSVEDEVRALGGLGDAAYACGRMRSAHEALKQRVEKCRANGLVRIEVANSSQMANAAVFLDPLASVVKLGQEVAEAAAKVGHHRAHMNALGGLCVVAQEMGDVTLLKQSVEQALELATKLNATAWMPQMRAFLATEKYLRGDLDDAERLAEEASRMATEFSAFTGPWVFGLLSMVTQDADRRERALREGERLLAQGSMASNPLHFYRFAMEASLAANDWEQTERYAQALEDFTSRESLPLTDYFVARGRVLAQVGRGDNREAQVELRRLLALASEADYRLSARALETALAAM